MAKLEILMPTMGESIFECTVLKWLVKEGDTVAIDDMILEVATDKIDTEIGSSHDGVITKFLVQEGDVAVIGEPICILETSATTVITEEVAPDAPEEKKAAEVILSDIEKIQTHHTLSSNSNGKFYSPLVLNIAKTENISSEELHKIKGTGLENRVTKHDILAYLENKKNGKATPPNKAVHSSFSSSNDQVVEMDRMRKVIAQRMVDSKRISPHVTSFIESDLTHVVKFREAVKDQFKHDYKENFTYTPVLIQAVIQAIKKYPAINIQVSEDNIIFKNDINIGMAVALPNGNLIVPVIHRADQYTLAQLALKVNDLANRARHNQLKPEELAGGTYTVTNIGSFGNLSGTPIILQPQVAILAFGVIRKVPAVIETPEGDFIGIRQKMVISHSYDHRVVDGSLGGLFLKEVSDYFENFNLEKDLNS
jgi:2-oxoglutarate dehydrogenase E2 component (dihydrolipoamide succinyltransferase)